jgi:hypothetical protein
MTNKAQAFCAVMGPLAGVLFLVTLWPLAHFLPPTDPGLSASEIVAVYTRNVTGIRLAADTTLIFLAAIGAFYAGITSQMLRMQGRHARTWAFVQLALGEMSLMPVYGTAICWAVAAYRLERAPEITQALNDVAWFCLIMPVAPALIQFLAIGFGTLSDTSSTPVYPRWYGYLAFWIGVGLMVGLSVPFFKHGPFAWNGLITFWLAALVLTTFLNINGYLMYAAAKRLGPDPPRENFA